MNIIKIDAVRKKRNIIEYDYTVEGNWSKHFVQEKKFYAEYNIDISNVPDSIACIPFVSSLLPISWILDAKIIVPCLDECFYKQIDKIKAQYSQLHEMPMRGEIVSENLETNIWAHDDKSLLTFSCGVDSVSTLISNSKLKPDLVVVLGADIKDDNVEGGRYLIEQTEIFADIFKVNSYWVKSSLRAFFDEYYLNNLIHDMIHEYWWFSMQHNIGMIGLVAPLACVLNKKYIFFAGTYTEEFRHIKCASWPNIDNEIKYGDSLTIHDGYELTRQEKVRNIIVHGKELPLRVCWRSLSGKNCIQCEKCYRTIMEIIAEGGEPNEYGFLTDDHTYISIKEYFDSVRNLTDFMIIEWKEIQDKVNMSTILKEDKRINWVLNIDFDAYAEDKVDMINNLKKLNLIARIKNIDLENKLYDIENA